MALKPEIMTTEEARRKAYDIALCIQANNPDWSAHREIDNREYVFLTHKTGAMAMIDAPYSPKKGAKFTGGLRVGRGQDYSTGPRLEIGVSMERTNEQCARAFEKRLLPAVLEKYKTHLEGKKKDEDYKAAYRATVVRMADAVGVKPSEGERTEFGFARVSDNSFSAAVGVESPNSVNIHLRYVPAAMAEKILTLIKGVL